MKMTQFDQAIKKYLLFEEVDIKPLKIGDWVIVNFHDLEEYKNTPFYIKYQGRIGKIVAIAGNTDIAVFFDNGDQSIFYRYELTKVIPTDLNSILDI